MAINTPKSKASDSEVRTATESSESGAKFDTGATAIQSGSGPATAQSDPAKAANEAASNAGTSREEASQSAESGTVKDRQPMTQLEAMQAAAVASRRGDGTLGASSDTLEKPSAELRAVLTQDALTARRETLQREAQEAGSESFDNEKLIELWDEVEKLNAELSDVMRRRDAARDAFDRMEATRYAPSHGESVVKYTEAQNKLREERARANKARRGRDAA